MGVPNPRRLLISRIDPNTIIPPHNTNADAGLGTPIPMDLLLEGNWRTGLEISSVTSAKQGINKTRAYHHVVTKPTQCNSQLESKANCVHSKPAIKLARAFYAIPV